MPPWDSDELSGMRAAHMGPTQCRNRGRQLSDSAKSYRGLALARHNEILAVGATVKDTREVWCGHVDILLPFKRRRQKAIPGEPVAQDGLEASKISEVANALKKLFTFVDDDNLETNWPAN